MTKKFLLFLVTVSCGIISKAKETPPGYISFEDKATNHPQVDAAPKLIDPSIFEESDFSEARIDIQE